MTGLRVALLGEPADLELTGAEGRFTWGEITLRPADGAFAIELVREDVAAGDAIAWHAGSASVVREGEHVWRRLPWPSGTRAFELKDPLHGTVLIVGPREFADPIAERLAERSVTVDRRERVVLEALEAASVVCLPAKDGAPPPAETMAVLAAGRILVTGRCEPCFGLQPGIDCFMESTADGAAQRVEAAMSWPRAFDLTRALGRVAATRHRADVLLHRLAVDAALGVT
jgi:hypothetical protein